MKQDDIKYYPFSSSQMLLFYSMKFSPFKQLNNIGTAITFEREVDYDVLRKAIIRGCMDYECLGMRITTKDKQGVQYFVPSEEPTVGLLDFTGKTEEKMAAAFDKDTKKNVTHYNKPMYRISMVKTPDGFGGIFSVISHIAMDAYAIFGLYGYIFAIYKSMMGEGEMPAKPASFIEKLESEKDYQTSERFKADAAFWHNDVARGEPIFTSLNGKKDLYAYRKKCGNPDVRYAPTFYLDTRGTRIYRYIPAEDFEKMLAFGEKYNVSPQGIFLTAFSIATAKINDGEHDIKFNSVNSRRATRADKSSGGCRVHYHPLRFILDDSASFSETAQSIYAQQVSMMRHADFNPLGVVKMEMETYKIPRMMGHSTLSVTYQAIRMNDILGEKAHTYWLYNGVSAMRTYVFVMDDDGSGALRVYYEVNLGSGLTVENADDFHAALLNALEAGLANPDAKIGELLG